MQNVHERHINGTTGRLAAGLGWFSVGLGLAELAAPGAVAGLIGVKDDERTRGVLRVYGLRELAAGVGILSQPESASGWLWARVGGDLMDLASLTSAAKETREGTDTVGRAGMATAAVLGVTALDAWCATRLSRERAAAQEESGALRRFVETVIVNKPVDDVYRFWRNLNNLPSFMESLESVQTREGNRSHWVACGPAGARVEWEAEMTEDRPGSFIAWRSVEGSDVYNEGAVHFERATGGRGTLVRVELAWAPPGGAVSAAIAKLMGRDPRQQINGDLRRFKQVMETGEVVKSDSSIHRGMHPARPSA